MNCAELEVQLADYIDDTLGAAERAALEQHAASCAGCREFVADSVSGAAFLKRAEEVLPPPELLTRLAYLAPIGRVRQPYERQGLLSRLKTRFLLPVLQPRLAMGMALTILSFAMLERCTGVRVQTIQPADLNPGHVWVGVVNKVIRTKDRAVKNYENIRLVYEIETRWREFQAQDAAAVPAQKGQAGQQNKGDTK